MLQDQLTPNSPLRYVTLPAQFTIEAPQKPNCVMYCGKKVCYITKRWLENFGCGCGLTIAAVGLYACLFTSISLYAYNQCPDNHACQGMFWAGFFGAVAYIPCAGCFGGSVTRFCNATEEYTDEDFRREACYPTQDL